MKACQFYSLVTKDICQSLVLGVQNPPQLHHIAFSGRDEEYKGERFWNNTTIHIQSGQQAFFLSIMVYVGNKFTIMPHEIYRS